MSNIEDIEAKVREMANLTVLSNKINEIQEKNLKMFGLVYFNGVASVKIDYDLANLKTDEDKAPLHSNYVNYHLTIDETQDNSKLDIRFGYLERSVRNLFWNDIAVKLFFNNKQVFRSK